MGKPISDSLKVDIPGCGALHPWYAEAVDKVYDEVAPTGPGALALDHARAAWEWSGRSCRGISRW